MRLIPILFICPALWATTTLQVTGATNTQARIDLVTNQTGACTVKVSAVDDFTGAYAPIHDVDPALFSGSDACNRPFNLTNSNGFTLVIGRREAATAADGKVYSRALQCLTTYYVQVTVGADTAVTQFATANIPVGATWNDPLPSLKNVPGAYAWPTWSQTDRTQEVVDPQTGALLKHLSLPGDLYSFGGDISSWITQQNWNFASQNGASPWTNPGNIITNSTPTATISGSTNPLFLVMDLTSNLGTIDKSHSTAVSSVGYIQLPIVSWCSDSGDTCPGVLADNRTLQFCLTLDGATCSGVWIDQAVTGCNSGCTSGNAYTIGSTTRTLASWFSGTPNFDITSIEKHAGTVTCDGSATVHWFGGDGFSALWGAGSTITINSVIYTLASVTDTRTLTLAASCPTSGGGTWNYSALNFGVLVRKKTISADTLFVQSMQYQYTTDGFPLWDSAGDEEQNFNCSPLMVAGPGGEMGFHCVAGSGSNGELVWIGDTTGTVTRIGIPHVPSNSDPTDGWSTFFPYPGLFWSRTDPNSWYALTDGKGGAGKIILKATYSGSNADIGPFQQNQNTTAGLLQVCGSPPSPPCWTITDVTPPSSTSTGGSLSQQMVAFSSDYAAFSPGLVNMGALAGNNLTFQVQEAGGPGNNGLGFSVIFSMATNQVVGVLPSWKHYPNLWSGLHGPIAINDSSYYITPNEGMSGPLSGADTNGNGPYIAHSVNAIPATGQACPAYDPTSPIPQAEWPTGNNCITLTMDGAPCDPSPGPSEPPDSMGTHCGNTSAFYLQDAPSGSVFCAVNDPSTRPFSTNVGKCGEYYNSTTADPCTGSCVTGPAVEEFRLLTTSGNTWVAQRGYYGIRGPRPFVAKNANASIIMIPGTCDSGALNDSACPAALAYWNFVADPLGLIGDTYVDQIGTGSGHGVTRPGVQAYSVSASSIAIDGQSNISYNIRTGATIPLLLASPNLTASNDPPFNWKVAYGQPNSIDGHPSYSQYFGAIGQELTWFGDMRPFLGKQYGGILTAPPDASSGTLYQWHLAHIGKLRNRILPTMATAEHRPLLDISGPSSVITNASSDAWKYCIALKSNECQVGSTAGDLFVNSPYSGYQLATDACPYMGTGDLNADLHNVCVTDNGSRNQAMTQTSWTIPDNVGAYSRVLSHLLGRYYWTDQFWNWKQLPDGKWGAVMVPWLEGLRNDIVLVKIPPFPNPTSYVPNGWIPVTIQVPPGTTGDTVAVRFGYVENEPAGSTSPELFCTSRQEACYTTTETTVPFRWASETQSWTPCDSGCTVTIPAIGGRVLYYAIDRKNGAITTLGGIAAVVVE